MCGRRRAPLSTTRSGSTRATGRRCNSKSSDKRERGEQTCNLEVNRLSSIGHESSFLRLVWRKKEYGWKSFSDCSFQYRRLVTSPPGSEGRYSAAGESLRFSHLAEPVGSPTGTKDFDGSVAWRDRRLHELVERRLIRERRHGDDAERRSVGQFRLNSQHLSRSHLFSALQGSRRTWDHGGDLEIAAGAEPRVHFYCLSSVGLRQSNEGTADTRFPWSPWRPFPPM